jgi:hypothetical protein
VVVIAVDYGPPPYRSAKKLSIQENSGTCLEHNQGVDIANFAD